jgi:hypothetical protein
MLYFFFFVFGTGSEVGRSKLVRFRFFLVTGVFGCCTGVFGCCSEEIVEEQDGKMDFSDATMFGWAVSVCFFPGVTTV